MNFITEKQNLTKKQNDTHTPTSNRNKTENEKCRMSNKNLIDNPHQQI